VRCQRQALTGESLISKKSDAAQYRSAGLRAAEQAAREFGESLRAARIRLGISQVELAGRAGTTQSRISYIEGGGGPAITLSMCARLAEAVECSLSPMALTPRSR
jgi:DNA-binding Xre family transcriptional regulator